MRFFASMACIFVLTCCTFAGPVYAEGHAGAGGIDHEWPLLAASSLEQKLEARAAQPDTATHGVPGENSFSQWMERLLQGSFLGSFFLGYPYSGAGVPDIAVIAVAALLALRLLFRRATRRRIRAYAMPQNTTSAKGAWHSGKSFKDLKNPFQKPDGSPEESDTPAGAFEEEEVFSTPRPRTGSAASAGIPEADRASSPLPDEPAGPVQKQEEGLADAVPEDGIALGKWAAVSPGLILPPDFDAAYFLEWARSLYVTLQYAWASRQVEDLEPYVGQAMFNTLKAQAAKDPRPVQVEIRFVHSLLSSLRYRDDWAQVGILFTVSMCSGSGTRPVSIRELWHFTCGGEEHAWRVESIEQA